jgi:hypothetical protein
VKLATALCLLFISAPAFAQNKPLQLDAKTQARLQLRVSPVQPAHTSPTMAAFASVMDATPLLTLLSDLSAAQSAYNASHAEAVRAQGLAKDATLSTKAAEAADAQARGDQAKLALLKQRLALEWGTAFASMTDTNLRQLGQDLSVGKAALVRIDTPSGKGLKGATSVTLDVPAAGSVTARILGVARTADQRLQSPGLISLVSGPSALYLNSSLTMKASLFSDDVTKGVLIPNTALLRNEGQIFAYVKSGPKNFVRRQVTSAGVTTEGVIVNQGFSAGDLVVVQGASSLLTAEAATPAGQ